MSFEEEKQLEETYVMHTFGRKPVELVSGQGMVAKDDKGNEYLDFIAGIGVNSLGHCHPALSEALAKQASRLIHVSNYYYIENRGELARDLSELLNETVPQDQREPWQTFFANSGAEANECAIKLARLHARRKALEAGSDRIPRTIVTLQRSFHGRTLATLAATAQPAKQEAFQPLPDGFVAVPANDIQTIEALFEQMGNEICAVLLEPIQGESGVHPCTAEFLQAVRRLTKQHGALMMLDEVQCGMFRCGTYAFAFQHFGVVPDVVTMAKGIAVGGSNLAITAAKTVIDTVKSEGIAQNATEVGAYLQERLASLEGVVAVRGLGLMVAADLAEGLDATQIAVDALGKGLLLNATGLHTLRFLPPLICTKYEVDTLVDRLKQLL